MKGKVINYKVLVFFALIIMFSLVPQISAQESEFTHVVANSKDWRDVYSTMIYARLEGVQSSFLVSEKHGPILLRGIRKDETLRVISSRDQPFVFGYDNLIEDQGFAGAEEIRFNNINLDLAESLEQVNNYIILDDSYGYNTASVASYAVKSNSYVLFVDRTNVDEIVNFLSNKNLGNLILYGELDREVRDSFEEFSPEIINNGDRFNDNIEIVKKYLEISPTKQVVLTNGEFIENEIISGVEPVLFIGKNSVPPQTIEYIQSTDLETGVLIGNGLIGVASDIRRTTGLSVFVKFARGARNPSGPIAAVEGLDLFYLPVPQIILSIDSIKYNTANSQLEITYRSDSDIGIYLRGTITVSNEEGEEITVGDVEPIFINSQEFKTVIYSDVDITGKELTADISTLFGESRNALDKLLEGRIQVEFINILDECEIDITEVVYNKGQGFFSIPVENIGPVKCYVDIELEGVVIGEEEELLTLDGILEIERGKTQKAKIRGELNEIDLEDNEFITLTAYYGQRENSLIKIFKGKFLIQLANTQFLIWSLAIILISAIAGLIFFLLKRRKKEDQEYKEYKHQI